jgi:formate hydrogenlyase subunit 3/multisubunit Na+/H+ antiporter MnhD subunit
MNSRNLLIVLCVALLGLIVVAALGPSKMVPRTGLGWQFDHFAGYFVVTSMLCGVWRRVFATATWATAFALLLEICQGLTPDRFPDFMAAFYSTSGILAATLLADLVIRSRRQINYASFLKIHY